MLQTPQSPKKLRAVQGMAPFETSVTAPSTKYATPYLGLPAKYCGIPNFMQYRIGPGADLAEAALSYADLRWSNLRGANLKGAKIVESALWGSTLTNAILVDCDLSHADLTGADLVGADLSGAKVKGACFVGARYSKKSTRFPKRFGSPEAKGMVAHDECYSGF